jgi:hypothetical protein
MTNRDDYLSAVNQPGAFQRVRWETTVKPAAAHKGRHLRKVATATIRTGVQYANLAVNADRETGKLPFGEWVVYPYIITHRGVDYARLYVLDGTIRTVYFVDGVEVGREAFLSYLTPSQRKPSRPTGGTITPKLESVTLL